MIKTDLLSLLEKSSKPISVPEILTKIPANKTTIYRELQSFAEEGLITEVQFGDGKKRYELEKKHHHHLICESCGEVSDVVVNEATILKKVQTENKFKVRSHSIEFFGLCRNCK